MYSTSSGSRFDGIDLARRRRPEQERHLAPGPDRLVGQHPDAGHPEPARDQQQVPAARVDLERAPERPEQIDRVARPQSREPVRATSDDPEVDRDDARRGVRGVERERATQDHPGEVAGPGMDELARARTAGQRRGVIRLEPLARQDLPTLDQLGRSEPHRHAVGSSSVSASSSSPSSAWSVAASSASASSVAVSPVPLPDAPASSGATAGKASASASARSPKTSVGS